MAGTYSKINRALSRQKEGVKRRAQTTDEELYERREKERMARARAKRLKDMGITDTTVK